MCGNSSGVPKGKRGPGAGGSGSNPHPANRPDTGGQCGSLGICSATALGRMEEGLRLLREWPEAKQPQGQLHRQLV